MPKYRVHTDKGDFVIETENPAETPAGRQQNADITEEERKWKSIGVPVDDAGIPNSGQGPTWQQQLMYDMKYPSPGKQLAVDAATALAGYVGGRASGYIPEGRIQVHPEALLNFKVTEPLKVLGDLFSVKPKPSPTVAPMGRSAYPGAPSAPESPAGVGAQGRTYFTPLREPKTFRVPYGAVNPPPATAGPLNLSHGFPSSLEDALTHAVDAIRAEGTYPGGGGGTGAGGIISPPVPGAPPTPGTSLPTGDISLQEMAQSLRRYFGSADTARQVLGSASPANRSHIIELAGGGRSQVPLSVEEKTLDELFKQMVDKDK